VCCRTFSNAKRASKITPQTLSLPVIPNKSMDWGAGSVFHNLIWGPMKTPRVVNSPVVPLGMRLELASAMAFGN
jgi:hypothetical protein